MKAIFLTIIATIFCSAQAYADDIKIGKSGLALPRMVSLRYDKVNARSGPGINYPIDWVYQQKGAPIEVIDEYEVWRKVKDWEGSVSWVKQSMITGKRFVKVMTLGENNIHNNDSYKSKVIAKVEDAAVGEVKKCTKSSDFCLIKFDTIEGWVPKKILFGIYPHENLD